MSEASALVALEGSEALGPHQAEVPVSCLDWFTPSFASLSRVFTVPS